MGLEMYTFRLNEEDVRVEIGRNPLGEVGPQFKAFRDGLVFFPMTSYETEEGQGDIERLTDRFTDLISEYITIKGVCGPLPDIFVAINAGQDPVFVEGKVCLWLDESRNSQYLIPDTFIRGIGDSNG